MKKIIVTGGAGYIGSHTCKALSIVGYEPICFDNLITGHKEFAKWGPFEYIDIRDTGKLKELIKFYNPIAVMHFAGSAYVEESVISPLSYYQNNVSGSLSLFSAMNEFGVDKLVFSSSCSTYGVPMSLPITEDLPQSPINPYGRSKLIIERVLVDMQKSLAIKYVGLRYFNAAGEDQDGDLWEWHIPETHLIPLAIKSALMKKTFKIFGRDYSTKDGTAVRDFVHVSDIAQAHVLALEYLIEGGGSTFINLGTNFGHSVLEIIDAVRSMGLNLDTIDCPKRPGDPPILIASYEKASQILGWRPTILDLNKILLPVLHSQRAMLRDNLS